jgi:hypothetical protein
MPHHWFLRRLWKPRRERPFLFAQRAMPISHECRSSSPGWVVPQVPRVGVIFEKFVLSRLTDTEIARDLDGAGICNHHGRPWTARMVNAILRNENYIGSLVYNRTSRLLGQKLMKNPNQF